MFPMSHAAHRNGAVLPQTVLASARPGAEPLEGKIVEPWLQPEAVKRRRETVGLNDPVVAAFCDSCEFLSLGCYCGPACTLKSLGLKKVTYPFDWVRTPSDGVIHCLQTNFEDFLTFTSIRAEGPEGKSFASAKWGGSFWHHDLQRPGLQDDFTRRIERFLGDGEVADSTTRVFVRAANSTRELELSFWLHEALVAAFPNARVYLVVLVDMQTAKGAFRVAGTSDVLFCRIHEKLFADNAARWTMEQSCDAYAEAIGFAACAWSGNKDFLKAIKEVPSLQRLSAAMDDFDGGNTANELFLPRRFQGHRISLRRKRDEAVQLTQDALEKLDSNGTKPAASYGAGTASTAASTPPTPGQVAAELDATTGTRRLPESPAAGTRASQRSPTPPHVMSHCIRGAPQRAMTPPPGSVVSPSAKSRSVTPIPGLGRCPTPTEGLAAAHRASQKSLAGQSSALRSCTPTGASPRSQVGAAGSASRSATPNAGSPASGKARVPQITGARQAVRPQPNFAGSSPTSAWALRSPMSGRSQTPPPGPSNGHQYRS